MSKVQELLKKRAAIIGQMQALTDKADAENRYFSQDEERQWNEQDAEVKSLSGRIAKEEILAAYAGESTRHTPAVYEPADDERSAQKAQSETSTASKKWGNLGEFLRAVVHAGSPGHRVDPRLLESRAAGLSEGVNADGGFLVDKDFSTEILQKVYSSAALASRCRRVQISGQSNGLKINAIDESSRVDGSRFGGVQAYWAAEAAAATASKPKFRQMELSLKKLMALCYVTDELLSDTTALQSVVADSVVRELAYKLDDAILNGDGDGKPSGILAGGGLVTVAKDASQAAATVTKTNLFNMRARLWAGARANAVWLVNQSVEPQLYGLTLGDNGAYFPQGTFANQPFDQLFGRPVIACEQCKQLGTVGDIVLADFGEYLLIEKGGIKGETSIHVRFLYDELAFRWTLRVDGKPIWSDDLTPAYGSDTLSAYVALATRA
jgi:HK97 family phage major capsid protein